MATQKILAAAEDIDQAADNLAAALKDGIDRGLAQDIRDRAVQIFEACNFQDLTSQRVTKVMTALKEIEAEIASALAEIAPAGAAPAVQGPRLESDRGRLAARYRHPVRPRLARSGFNISVASVPSWVAGGRQARHAFLGRVMCGRGYRHFQAASPSSNALPREVKLILVCG